jgi:hypothetical protein
VAGGGSAHDDVGAREAAHELHVADDVLHRRLEDVAAAQREPRRRHDECAADVGQRPPAADDAEPDDVLARVEELAQRGVPQRGGVAAAQSGEQRAVAGDAPDRRVADGPVGLLLVDPPGHAAKGVGAYAGDGRCGWVLIRRLLGGAARQRHGRDRQDGERDARHDGSLPADA